MQHLTGGIDGAVAEIYAILRLAGHASKRAALYVAFESLPGETVFRLKVYRSPQRVQAEYRVVRPQIGAFDHIGRDQVPVDGVPERLVEPDPVHVDGKPLRRALQRGSGKAAVVEFLRDGVAVRIGNRHAGNLLEQRFGDRRRRISGEILAGHRMHGRRYPVATHAPAGERCRRYLDGGKRNFGRGAGIDLLRIKLLEEREQDDGRRSNRGLRCRADE